MDAGIVVKVEDYDGMCKCLFCGPSVRGQPALKIDTASLSARSHRPGVRGGSRCRGGCTDRGCGSGGRGARGVTRGRRHLGRGKCGCGGSTGGANRSRKGQQRQGQGACGGRRRPGFWRRGRGDEHGSWCGWRRRRRQGQGSRGQWLSRGLEGEERYGLQRRRKAGRGLGALGGSGGRSARNGLGGKGSSKRPAPDKDERSAKEHVQGVWRVKASASTLGKGARARSVEGRASASIFG